MRVARAYNTLSITNVTDQKSANGATTFYCDAPAVITLIPTSGDTMAYIYDLYVSYDTAKIKKEPVRTAVYYHDYFKDTKKYDSAPADESAIWAYADGTYITLTEAGEYTVHWINADVEDLEGSFIVIVGGATSSTTTPAPAPTPEKTAPAPAPEKTTDSVTTPTPAPAPTPAPTVKTTASTATLKTTVNLVKTVPPTPIAGQDLAYKVQKGEALWSIAYNYYGSMSDATVGKIKAANASYFKSTKGILETGATITLPAKGLINPVTQSSLDKAAGVYLIKSGDTLADIAKTYYGDAKQWKKIYEANKDRVKMVGKSPMIYEGQWLIIVQ